MSQAAVRPNILLITTDQQRFDTLQCAGNRYIYTPHLNWLADTGIRFANCYSDCPVCAPARATIMTGRYAYNHGLTSNSNRVKPMSAETSLPGLLSRAGYQTRAQGKMHFSPNRCHYGFETMEILDDYYRTMARHPEYGVPMNHGIGQNEMTPVISTVDETHSLTHWTVDRSIDFLETRDPTRPFFLWTSFTKPHPPFDPCRNYWELYRDRPTPEPVTGDWSRTPDDVPTGWRLPSAQLNMIWRFSPEQAADIRRAYYACITQIDYTLGLLFARLRELDLFKNTLVIFTSDHGEMLGDHHLGAKSYGFEGSAHVPMLVRPPQTDWVFTEPRRGSVCDEIVCLADILPTCAAAAGVRVPGSAKIDGIDLLRIADGKKRRPLLHGDCDNYHYVLQGRWKYLFEAHGGTELLFNLADDPYEQQDLSRDAGAQAHLKDLRDALIKRLTAGGNAAVHNGRLRPTSPDVEKLMRERAGAWPGFHSRLLPSDLAH
jgi:arylsulfatase A-like enzyme